MKRVFRLIGMVAMALLLVSLAAAVWKRDEIARLLAVNSLFREDRIVANFIGMDRLFHHRILNGGTPTALPVGEPAGMPAGFDTWLVERRITGVVVLHDGRLVHESYHLGTAPADRRISWSVAKSALSLLLGILHHDGAIPDLDAPVTRHAPALAGSAYEGATIRQVLQMASGVAFDEDYLDYNSDINRMGRVLALGGSMDAFAAGLTARRGAPGADWQYVSIDTHVLGMVIRGATGRSVSDLMEERILIPLGLEREAIYLTDGHGVEFVLGGLNMTTRDYARLGQMLAQGGRWQGRQIVPEAWITRSTAPSAPAGAPYGYQWWLPDDPVPGEFYARGVYGQFLWIDRNRNVVIAVNAADRGFSRPGVIEDNIAMFRAIARALDENHRRPDAAPVNGAPNEG